MYRDSSKGEKIILDDDAQHKKSSPEILDIDLIQSGAERKRRMLTLRLSLCRSSFPRPWEAAGRLPWPCDPLAACAPCPWSTLHSVPFAERLRPPDPGRQARQRLQQSCCRRAGAAEASWEDIYTSTRSRLQSMSNLQKEQQIIINNSTTRERLRGPMVDPRNLLEPSRSTRPCIHSCNQIPATLLFSF